MGKWVLRNLFTQLIDEEIRRDEYYRKDLLANTEQTNRIKRENAPTSIILPDISDGESAQTPKPNNGVPSGTAGITIGAATPGVPNFPATKEEDLRSEPKTPGQVSSGARSNDYFSTAPNARPAETPTEGTKVPVTPGEAPNSPDTEGEKKKGLFGKSKKFQMSFPKLGRNSVDAAKPPPPEEKAEESDKSSEKEEIIFDDNLFGVIQKIRHEYDEHLMAHPGQGLPVGITPSLPNETPVLKPPAHTQILIQEDSPESGGVIDLYRGTLSTLKQDIDLIEKVAPMWLGDLLLRVSSVHWPPLLEVRC